MTSFYLQAGPPPPSGSAGANDISMTENLYHSFRCSKLKQAITRSRCLINQREALAFWGEDAARFNSCPCETGIEIRGAVQKMSALPGPSRTLLTDQADDLSVLRPDPDEAAPAGNMEEEDMKDRKECRNCGRLMTIAQDGLCGGCWWRCKGLSGDEKERALAQAAIDLAGRDPLPRGRRRKADMVKPQHKDIVVKLVKRRPGGALLTDEEYAAFLKDAKPVEVVAAEHPPKIRRTLGDPPRPPATKPMSSSDSIRKAMRTIQGPPTKRPFPVDDSITILFTTEDAGLSRGLLTLARKYRRTPEQQLLWLLEHELSMERIILDHKADAPFETPGDKIHAEIGRRLAPETFAKPPEVI